MKYIVMFLMIAALVMSANATAPPAHNGYTSGWGMNPTNWDSASGSYNSGLTLYPAGGSGGGAWLGWGLGGVWGTPIAYAPISLELWIEMNCIQTYQYTSYAWHRLGAGDTNTDIVFTIDGTIQSNELLWVSMTEMSPWNPLGLQFQHNNGVGDDYNVRSVIPISWQVRWGTGLTVGGGVLMLDYTTLSWTGTTPNRQLQIPPYLPDHTTWGAIPACDHWFQFKGTIDLEYHEADGYYKTMYGGCPDPGL